MAIRATPVSHLSLRNLPLRARHSGAGGREVVASTAASPSCALHRVERSADMSSSFFGRRRDAGTQNLGMPPATGRTVIHFGSLLFKGLRLRPAYPMWDLYEYLDMDRIYIFDAKNSMIHGRGIFLVSGGAIRSPRDDFAFLRFF